MPSKDYDKDDDSAGTGGQLNGPSLPSQAPPQTSHRHRRPVPNSPASAWSRSDSSANTTDSSTPSPDSSLLPPANETRSDPHDPHNDQCLPDVDNDCLWPSTDHMDESMPWWRAGEREDLVISGVSGRFPESDNVAEFAEHLMNGDDLITSDDRRWEIGFYELPQRHGKLKELKKFDAQFFGVPPKQANYMDPQLRILLEVAYEAIIDSGYNPMSLRGTKTGVFVGCSASETASALTQDPETINGYSLTGCTRSMFANRLSYSFDFRGPSFAVDTACSSGMIALQLAVDAIRQDQCDAAIVAGTHLTLMPNSALQFLRLGMLSNDGMCKSFDANGQGYVRGEAISAIFIQKSSDARRCYATVVHAKSNTDGYKQQGITFPSGDQQATLLEEVYREAGIDPRRVVYVETHGTGTKVGDPQEANAIAEVFCRDRDDPLLIGSVKSSMGHAEPASGLCSIAKVLIAMERGVIPPNLHFAEPNPYIPALTDGRLKVVSELTPWSGGLVGVNSFGFGGSNTHVLLRSRPDAPAEPRPACENKLEVPKLLCYAGRTTEAVQTIFTAANAHLPNPYFYSLLSEQSNQNVTQCPYRGFTLMNRDNGQEPLINVQKVNTTEARPVCFVYSGMGTQWAGMGQEMMRHRYFKQSILRCSEALRSLGVDPYSLIMKGDEEVWKDTMQCMICITAIQIALTDLLKEIGIEPDVIVGHSTGEMACGYADGCLTREQTMLLAYYRGYTIMHGGLNGKGGMAAVGLTWEETKKRVPEGVVAACHNAADSVTVSGDYEKVMEFVNQLKEEEIFAKFVQSSGVPFHSPAMLKIRQPMLDAMSEVIPEPKKRTSRWISSSVPESEWDSDRATWCNAEYQCNNAMSSVLFYEALQKVPENAVTIEIAPHALLQAILRRTLPSTCANVGLMKGKAPNQLEVFLSAIGKIYQAGVPVHVQRLYGQVPYPVPKGTPMISPLVRWDHSVDWPVVNAKEMGASGVGGGVAASTSFTIDPFAQDSKEKYVLDHVIDGRCLFPFTGHIVLAWRAVCKLRGLDYQKTGVMFDEINVYRPTIMTKAVKFDVVVAPGGGQFEILENDSLTASGHVQIIDEPRPWYYEHLSPVPPEMQCDRVQLDTADIYKEFVLRGYEYGPAFRGICKARNSGLAGELYWTGNWVTFLDALLQSALLAERQDTLRLPTRLRYLRIDPEKHVQAAVTKDGKEVIAMRNDIATNGCCAGGVEVCDLIAQNVQRRLHGASKVVMERVYFVEHHDSSCFSEGYTTQRDQLTAYKQCLQTVIADGLQAWKRHNLLQRLPNTVMFESVHGALSQKHLSPCDQSTIEFYRNQPGTHLLPVLLRVFNEINHDHDDWSNILAEEIRKQLPLASMDILANAAMSQRPLKPLIDMAMENTGGHLNKFAAIEPEHEQIVIDMYHLQITHPLLQLEWQVISRNPDAYDAVALAAIDCTVLKYDLAGVDPIPEAQVGKWDTLLVDRWLHKQIDIPRALQKLKELIRNDGFAMVVETTSDFETTFLLEGIVNEQMPAIGDGDRIYGLYLPHEQWLSEFKSAGFDIVAHQTDPSMVTTLYLLRKRSDTASDPTFVHTDDVSEFTWIEPLKQVIEDRTRANNTSSIWINSTKVRDNGMVGFALCLREEDGRLNRFRTVIDCSLDVTNDDPPTVSTEPGNAEFDKIVAEDLHANNYRDGRWGSFRHFVQKDDELHTYGQVAHAYINNLVRGDLSSLSWVESANQYCDDNQLRAQHLKMCAVYFTAVNFRDVMLASGRLPPDAIPGQFADRDCLLGMEFAGRFTDSGERIMGILPARALATTVVTDPEYSWFVPDAWTMQEAATVPVVYCTAYYALVVRARIRRGERVLVHSGSGGVGQAAIAVALSYGCEVFTTVSNEEKKQYLMQRFPQLRERHISNSRTLDFEWYVRQATQGRGVDVVLNSLSEEKLQASLRCLAQHGRFLEIGKFDLARNSQMGMALFLKNVTFHGILLDALMDGENPDWKQVAQLLTEGIQAGVVKPLQSTVYPCTQVEDAFRYMASGKHIGKVLVQVRPEEPGICVPSPITVRAVTRTLCNPKHVYLITGGLGGFGLELAQWLINRGAKKLVLTSRSGVRTGYQARCVYFWRRIGISVLISTTQISTPEGAERLLEQCQDSGPIGGLFHLAMVLRDCMFENQHVGNFKDAADAKYWGTRNLDQATRNMCGPELKWFVVFSSITAGRGNSGQTNYGWANSAMERMVERRRHDGHPGIAIQWGAIGDVGIIIESMGDNSTVVGGTLPQRMPSCLQCLDTFITWNHPIVGCYIRAETGKSKRGERGDVIESIAHIIGVSDVSQLDMTANLGDLGLDSLMGVEIKQALERDYDIVLSMKDIRTMTLTKLKELADNGGTPSTSGEQTAESKSDESNDGSALSIKDYERQMNQLFKLRIDVNDLLSFEKIVKMNDVPESSASRPVFFVHSIEGISTPLKKIASELDRPAYCLQCTPSAPLDAIETIAEYYILIMKDKQPHGPYDLVGYSYGACIAFEMACILENRDSKSLRTVILLDGSHHYMRTYQRVYRTMYGVKSDNLTQDPLFETEILCAFAMRFANFDYRKMRLDLLAQNTWNARVQKSVEAIMQTKLFKSAETVAWACDALRSKFLMADKYVPQRKLDHNIALLRAAHGAAREEDVGQDYGLQEVVNGVVDVRVIEGDHDTFVQGSSSSLTATTINQILASGIHIDTNTNSNNNDNSTSAS